MLYYFVIYWEMWCKSMHDVKWGFLMAICMMWLCSLMLLVVNIINKIDQDLNNFLVNYKALRLLFFKELILVMSDLLMIFV